MRPTKRGWMKMKRPERDYEHINKLIPILFASLQTLQSSYYWKKSFIFTKIAKIAFILPKLLYLYLQKF